MTKHMRAFEDRLSKVRRRWKAAAALDGLLLVATEALGLFVLLVLADAIYTLSGEVRLGMLGAGLLVLAVLLVRHVVRPILRRIPNEQIALYVEERSAKAEGSVISALECRARKQGGLSGFIAELLVGDAVRRIDQTNVRVLTNLRRLRKHLLVACGMLALMAVTSLSFPEYTRRKGRRIITPWVSIIHARQEARRLEQARVARMRYLSGPIEIDVEPKGMTILRGKGIEFAVTLSREPAADVVFHYRFAGADGKEHTIEMAQDQARLGYRLPFPDINESFTYHVTVSQQASAKYEIKVHDPLAVRGIELTYHYPDYLQRDPRSSYGVSGDVTALAGTRVDVRVVANNPLKSGTLRFDDQTAVAMKAGSKAQDGAAGSFTVQKDGSYTYELEDVYGETCKFGDFFFVKAVPDKPPGIKMVSPKVDMSVHPLCELTFAAKVTDDYAIRDATARLIYYRDGKPTPMPLAMKPTIQEDFRNFLDGKVEHVLELEKLVPQSKIGDMIFYHMEIADRKGQTARTDLFFVKLMPFEVVAAWPAEVSPPDLPHWDYLWTPDIILLAAAAWHIEQQRGKIPAGEFNAKCTQLAGRMEPAMNSQEGLNLLGGKQKLPRHILAAAGEILAQANAKLEKALGLLRGYQPGKAALEMQQAMALAESVNIEKALQETQMHQTPIHTGQPSGGYNQDTVMEQAEFRLPGVMSDSLTAFQQEDNPRHFLPPDYRRALRLKEQTAPLTKELRLAGQIYASQEQLLEMAREQFGHRKLREAAEMSCTNDPAAGRGTKGQMIRVDKRAVPWTSMDPNADMPQVGNRGQMKRPKAERIKGLKYARLTDNERAGPGSPHRSQTPGGGASDDEQDTQPESKKRKSYYDEQWKVLVNDRRPRHSQGGGGGGGRQQQQLQLGMQQLSQQPSGGASGSSRPGATQPLASRQSALADQTARLARGVSRNMDAGDAMGRRVAARLREASREMRQASASFQRGDLRTGIAQARRAQQAMQTAMHGMRAAQFGTLGEALAAAQQGASAMMQNQSRISQGTERVEQRIRELSGEAPKARPEAGRPQTGQPGQGQPGAGQPGKAPPGQGQPGAGQPGKAQPGEAQPGKGQPGAGQPGKGQPGQAQPGKGQPGTGQPGKAQPGKGQPGAGQPGKAQPGTGQPGKAQPGKGQPGKGQPGAGQPGKGQPGKAQPGAGGPGEGRHAEGQRTDGPSRADVAKAATRDPRVAARMQNLAGEQLDLSQSVKEFEAYVSDLIQWSQEARKDRVTTSLQDVTAGLKQDAVAQKMIDAGVDLSQQQIASARATQEDIEAALSSMTGRLREAGDILAGSKTGILSRTARQAKEIGAQVRRLAGLPQRSGAGRQQPGQGQPGQGQPSQGQPGQGQPGQGQPGQGQPSQGQPGQGQPGGGRPGPREDSLAQRLAAEQRDKMAMSSVPGRPGPGSNVPGGAGGTRNEIDDLWFKAHDLAGTLRNEQLADEPTLDYIHRRVKDPSTFRSMFDKVKKAEAGKFSDVLTGIGKSLDEVLKETLSAKKLHSERQEECPPKYRSFVDAYFEALSKAAAGKATN